MDSHGHHFSSVDFRVAVADLRCGIASLIHTDIPKEDIARLYCKGLKCLKCGRIAGVRLTSTDEHAEPIIGSVSSGRFMEFAPRDLSVECKFVCESGEVILAEDLRDLVLDKIPERLLGLADPFPDFEEQVRQLANLNMVWGYSGSGLAYNVHDNVLDLQITQLDTLDHPNTVETPCRRFSLVDARTVPDGTMDRYGGPLVRLRMPKGEYTVTVFPFSDLAARIRLVTPA